MEEQTEREDQTNKSLETLIADSIARSLMPQYHALFRGWKKLMENKYSKTDNLLSKIGIELADLEPGR